MEVRVQIHPTKNIKIEPWIINGWQSYGMFNKQPGLGGNFTWMPNEDFKLLTNDYYGADAAGIAGRKRFHSDNSLLVRYIKNPGSKGLCQGAFSLTADLGFEKGGGVNGFTDDAVKGPAQYFASIMFYNRLWFAKKKLAWTVGGGWMKKSGSLPGFIPYRSGKSVTKPHQPRNNRRCIPFQCKSR